MKLVPNTPAPALSAEALKTKHPDLIVGTDCAVAAKNLRKELKQGFTGVKFSVTTSRYAGGNSVDVEWQDGVTVAQVEAVANKYQDGTFNGSDDSYTYHHTTWKDTFGSAKFVMIRRTESIEFVRVVVDYLRQHRDTFGLNVETPRAEDYLQGRLSTDDPWRLAIRLTLVHSVFAQGVAAFNVEANNG